MKGLCCPLSLFVLLVASKCLEADARGGARFSAIENADSDGGKGKSGKGKSSGESGKTGKGKSSEESGKTGKGGKGKNGAGGGDVSLSPLLLIEVVVVTRSMCRQHMSVVHTMRPIKSNSNRTTVAPRRVCLCGTITCF